MKAQVAHFRINLATSHEIFEEWKTARLEVLVLEKVIAEVYEADIICNTSCSGLTGFGIKTEENTIKPRKGFDAEILTLENGTYCVYIPDLCCKEGKEFHELIKQYTILASKNPDFSDWFCNKYELHRFIVSNRALLVSVVDFVELQLVCKIPFNIDEPLPELPEFFELIEKSQYI